MNFSTEAARSDLNVSQWLLFDNLNGPAIAVIGTIELLLSLLLNLFIIIHTVHHTKDCVNKPSTFLLLILATVNLLQVVLYMPFWVIASGAGEWIFGSTDHVRSILCQIHGLSFLLLTFTALHTLSIISLDRFLSIVKFQFHKKYMSWKKYVIILGVLLIISIVLNLGPYYNPNIGEYGWVQSIGSCFPNYNGAKLLVSFNVVQAIIPLCIITITSAWTFVFTRGFLKRNLERNKAIMDDERFMEEKHIYAVQVKNLVGIFGSLMLLTILSWGPYFIISAIGLGVGFQNIPPFASITAFIIFLSLNISNPIIQIYFRKDLIDLVKEISQKFKMTLPSFNIQWRRSRNSPSLNDLDVENVDDNMDKHVQMKYMRAFSTPVIKTQQDSAGIIPDQMAASYSCGTMEL